MPLQREFQGKRIKRTVCVGDQVAVLFHAAEKGKPGEHALLPLADYLAEVRTTFQEKQSSPQSPGQC